MSRTNSNPPFLDMVWWDDFEINMQFEFGAWRMRKEDMVAFAKTYDPEPFHLDESESRKLGWDGLIASGLQISAIWRRLSKDAFCKTEMVISPGWDNIRWTHPVYPDDVLHSKTRLCDKRQLNSRPGEGLLKLDNDILRQDEKKVASLVSNWFVRKRDS